MRALAEFVMRGRPQAIAVAALAVFSQLLAVVGIAIVGLVTLRRGAKDGVIVMAWALLPALVLAVANADISGVVAVGGVTLAALSLRATRAWPQALLIPVVAGVLAAVLFNTIAANYVERWIASVNELFAELSRQRQGPAVPLPPMSVVTVSGGLGSGVCALIVLGLLLARWWQALLYNPGGFRDEFHQLRLPPAIAVGLLAVSAVMAGFGVEYAYWASIFAVPLVVAGLALVHGVVGRKRLGRGALIALYFAVLLIAWGKFVLLALALIDSFVNFRARIKPRTSD